MSDSATHDLQHARLPCPSPSPGVCSNSLSIESVMPSSHLILCHPLLLLPSIFPSIRIFSSESALLIRWPKCWSFNFSISLSNEYLEKDKLSFSWCTVPGISITCPLIGAQTDAVTSKPPPAASLCCPAHPAQPLICSLPHSSLSFSVMSYTCTPTVSLF